MTPTQADPTNGPSQHVLEKSRSQVTSVKDSSLQSNLGNHGDVTLKSVEGHVLDTGQRSRLAGIRSLSLDDRREMAETVPERQFKSQQTGDHSTREEGDYTGGRDLPGHYDNRMKRRISDLNQNPLVVWKDESDTGRLFKQ